MSDGGYDAYRQDRIERLLGDLRHEIERGVINHEISEHLSFKFMVPMSKEGPAYVVKCQFELRPIERKLMDLDFDAGRLRVIDGGKQK